MTLLHELAMWNGTLSSTLPTLTLSLSLGNATAPCLMISRTRSTDSSAPACSIRELKKLITWNRREQNINKCKQGLMKQEVGVPVNWVFQSIHSLDGPELKCGSRLHKLVSMFHPKLESGINFKLSICKNGKGEVGGEEDTSYPKNTHKGILSGPRFSTCVLIFIFIVKPSASSREELAFTGQLNIVGI